MNRIFKGFHELMWSTSLLDLSQSESQFLRLLYDVDITAVLRDIDDPVRNTCQWINHDERFRDWTSSTSRRFLWITGLAGSGKTVLTKYIIRHLLKSFPQPKRLKRSAVDGIHILC